ncbi:MAG: hypothetical protein ABI430_02130 [Candidatus Taylorbacteria bacterium]
MNKNYVIGGIVVIVVIAVIALAMNKGNTALAPSEISPSPSVTESVTPTPTPNPTVSTNPGTSTVAKVIVIYTNSGFSPKTVTVKKGSTVEFVNQSDGGMSVASDPHPTHVIYPEFDQYKTSARGLKVFDFVFDKVGTWGYHNHMQASNTGTVIVQ